MIMRMTSKIITQKKKKRMNDDDNNNNLKYLFQGGPKPKELPQLMPTVEFKTTPTGAKYKKIDYEIVDSTKTVREQDSTSSQYSSIEKVYLI